MTTPQEALRIIEENLSFSLSMLTRFTSTGIGFGDPTPTPGCPEDVPWFACRYCRIVYVAPPRHQPTVGREEQDECFVHEALCDQRPPGTPFDPSEQGALDRVYGHPFRTILAMIRLELHHLGDRYPQRRTELGARRDAIESGLTRLGLEVTVR